MSVPFTVQHCCLPHQLTDVENSFTDLQSYIPTYRVLFEPDEIAENMALNHRYHIVDAEHVLDNTTGKIERRDIHFKFSPLLDPFRYLTGKYAAKKGPFLMPPASGVTQGIHPKLVSYANASYVDCFFNFLSNMLLHHCGFVHGIEYYGTYIGCQRQFKVNITDDVEYFRNSKFFYDQVGKLFTTNLPQDYSSTDDVESSRRRRPLIRVASLDDVLLDDVTTGESCVTVEPIDAETSIEHVFQRRDSSPASSVRSDSELNYSSSDESSSQDDDDMDYDEDEDEDKDEDEDEEEDLPNRYAYINNFPTQLICMEKCEGTLDELFSHGVIDQDQGASALMQVVMTLLMYQRRFQFTHNDLHTNNIMFASTDVEFLEYVFQEKRYVVPTYGRIFKIIDFGRSIYKFQDHLFCSDSFYADGDAATQYNFGPILNEHKPVLEPNPSFDLCRLGVSIFDFVMDVDIPVDEMDEFQKTIYRWCSDDQGKNILYKRNGEDRYPNFKLYKMISRTVHQHTPEVQLEYPLFQQFLCTEAARPASVVTILIE